MVQEKSRRDLIFIVTLLVAIIGVLGLTWTLLGSMTPSADVWKEKHPIVDLSEIPVGHEIIVLLRGKPVLIRHRTAEEIRAMQAMDMSQLEDPETDSDRIRSNLNGEKDLRYIVLVFRCPLDGSLPVLIGDYYEKWLCQYSTARFDASGRSYDLRGFKNLTVPRYRYISDTTIELVPEPTPVELITQD